MKINTQKWNNIGTFFHFHVVHVKTIKDNIISQSKGEDVYKYKGMWHGKGVWNGKWEEMYMYSISLYQQKDGTKWSYLSYYYLFIDSAAADDLKGADRQEIAVANWKGFAKPWNMWRWNDKCYCFIL